MEIMIIIINCDEDDEPKDQENDEYYKDISNNDYNNQQ